MVSSQYLYCIPAIPLSTTLLGVDITPFGDDLNFKWSTATESNTSSYLVEILFDKGEWGVLDKKTAQGFSEKTTHYQSKLVNAAVGNHHFKLSEIDLNGDTTFLKLYRYYKSPKSIEQPYPNHSKDGKFQMTSNLTADSCFLYDSQGNTVKNEKFLLRKNGEELSIQLNNLEKRVYYLRNIQGQCYRLIYA